MEGNNTAAAISIHHHVMTSELSTHVDGAAHRDPFQFTIRSFLATALLVSLLFAAIHTLKGWPQASAVLLVVWLAVAGAYFLLRLSKPLLGLCLGPVCVTVVWCSLFGLVLVDLDHQKQLFFAEILTGCAFGWGIVLSLAVSLACGVRWKCPGRLPLGKSRRKTPEPFSYPSLACRMTVVRLAVTPLVALHVICMPEHALWLVVYILCIFDAPLAPLYLTWWPTSPDVYLHIVVSCVASVSGGVLYCVLGRILESC